jgi:hypothetical protein
MAKIIQEKCLGFPALRLVNNSIELVIVPELGGRVMSYGPIGCNFLFQNTQLTGRQHPIPEGSPAELSEERLKSGMLLYGGEKTWLAPQDDWGMSPYMALDHGVYATQIETVKDGLQITLTSPVCQETFLQITRILHFPEKGSKVSFCQRLENCGTRPVSKSLWQVTMLKHPAWVTFPVDASSSYPEGIKWWEGLQTVPDLMQKIKKGWLVRCEKMREFKLGSDVSGGWVDILVSPDNDLQRSAMIFRKEYPQGSGPYAHGCAVEIYNSVLMPYLEVEVVSPLTTLQPGEEMVYCLAWSLLPARP